MKSEKENIILALETLINKPSMLMIGNYDDYNCLYKFLEGLFTGIKLNGIVDVENEINTWYKNKFKSTAINYPWLANFELVNENKSETQKLLLLKETLKEFLKYWKTNN